MKTEIALAVSFLKSLVNLKNAADQEKKDLFAERLTVALEEKFQGHWYPENPSKGQAYRCIRMNVTYQRDPELLRACRDSSIRYSDLGLPLEFTLWVNPGEVFYRCREEDSIYLIRPRNPEKSTHPSHSTVNNRKCFNQTFYPCAPAWWFPTPSGMAQHYISRARLPAPQQNPPP